ncbi:uncharacterized protein LOC106473632 [Limulus polyphemus]|uniref:Uncharacterized protein LOC106473632 n=1 Tax=Limulus polyphemus TaxID=6850 RepID=A0ABM1TPD8_LIMPO|nr:uncharacterized protein LOC106473632 [Limulus polyphemus]
MTTSCTCTLLVFALIITEMREPLSSALCGLSEFSCDNGKCVRQNMFCNGREDCGDGSDEPRGCMVCNRTFNGEANVKYRLHISEPFRRQMPFLCVVSFVAGGAQYGDYVELRFLSFNVGSLEKGGASELTCYGGHLKVLDTKSPETDINHQQTRGLSQLVSAIKHTNGILPSLYNIHEQRVPDFGYFCGQRAVGRGVNYFSSGNNVTLLIFMSRKTSWRSQSFSVFLTYRFITRKVHVGVPKDDTKINVGIVNSFCNVEYRDCVNQVCVIRSPNFPGTFLPNFTCQYLIKQELVPKGFHAQVLLKQTNEYKISIDNGHSGPGAIPSVSLTTDCPRDVVRIFNGPTPDAVLLTEFCGTGPLPVVRSSQSNVLVQLVSAPYQQLHDSRLEIEAEVRFVKDPFWRISGNSCEFLIDDSRDSVGIIENPGHTVPPHTTCTYSLRGRNPSDRVWLYFTSYIVEDKHPWSLKEFCDTGRFEILGLAAPHHPVFLGNESSLENLTYCEKSSPRLCARAGETPNLTPFRPCRFPKESYFSKGPELILRLHYPRLSEISTLQPIFKARYEIVDTSQPGEAAHLPGEAAHFSLCDRFLYSRSGTIFSPRNVLYYGRGGSSEISCRYNLQGKDSSRVKIAFQSLHLLSSLCKNVVDKASHERTCEITQGHKEPISFIQVVENWQGVEILTACFCNISFISFKRRPIELTSLSNNVSLIFTVKRMTSLQDYRHFNFEASYEFFSFPICDKAVVEKNGSSWQLTLSVYEAMLHEHGQFRCKWSLRGVASKNLYIAFRGTNGTENCAANNNIAKVYSGRNEAAFAVVCLNDDATKPEMVVPFWYAMETSSFYPPSPGLPWLSDHVILETLIKAAQTVRVYWGEVTSPLLKRNIGHSLRKINCLTRCPEINACISPDLWCDGKKHCPSGYDEAVAHCQRFPVLYITAGVGATVLLLVLVVVTIIVTRRKRGRRGKQPIQIPTVDLFEMNGNRRTAEDRFLKY